MKFATFSFLSLLSVSLFFTGCKPKDADIQTSVNNQLKNQADLAAVTATVNDGVATLSGQVKTEADKNSAETITKGVNGVESVNNNITIQVQYDTAVAPPSTGLIADDQLMDSAKALVKNFPDVNVSVSAGVITVTGTINKDKKDGLIQSLKLLSDHGVNDQLQVK